MIRTLLADEINHQRTELAAYLINLQERHHPTIPLSTITQPPVSAIHKQHATGIEHQSTTIVHPFSTYEANNVSQPINTILERANAFFTDVLIYELTNNKRKYNPRKKIIKEHKPTETLQLGAHTTHNCDQHPVIIPAITCTILHGKPFIENLKDSKNVSNHPVPFANMNYTYTFKSRQFSQQKVDIQLQCQSQSTSNLLN